MTHDATDGGLQLDLPLVALLALLPKDGTRRSVLWLAEAADMTQSKVTNVLYPVWSDRSHGLSYDVTTDSYFIERGQA